MRDQLKPGALDGLEVSAASDQHDLVPVLVQLPADDAADGSGPVDDVALQLRLLACEFSTVSETIRGMTISAGLGIGAFPFDDARGFWRWVELCDAGEVDSIWQSDRLISKEPNLECMSVMAALAGATRRIKFGMNVASLGLRDPVQTAKQCATIDMLSEGRLLPAFGVGSPKSRDFVATGAPSAGRGKRVDESLEIMTRLWTEDEVSFQGDHYQLDRATISPKPVQDPLPLWIGGSSKRAIERTARLGTGWQAGIETAEQITPVVAAIKQQARKLGREIDEDHFGAGISFRFGRLEDPAVAGFLEFLRRLDRKPDGYLAVGGTDEILQQLQAFRDAGIHKFILRPIATGNEDVLKQTRQFIDSILPALEALN